MFLSDGSEPPITLLGDWLMKIPSSLFPTSPTVPVASGPMKLPTMVFPPRLSSRIPLTSKALITRPRTVLPPAVIDSPLVPGPAKAPDRTTMGISTKSGSVDPSIITGSLTVGRAVAGSMVWGPGPAISNWIRSGPPPLVVLLAAVIASRREIIPSVPGSAIKAAMDVAFPSNVSSTVSTMMA